jgi:hypothetical protein
MGPFELTRQINYVIKQRDRVACHKLTTHNAIEAAFIWSSPPRAIARAHKGEAEHPSRRHYPLPRPTGHGRHHRGGRAGAGQVR